MKIDLLSILRCPYCRESLTIGEITRKERREIITGKLVCRKCGRIYPIVSGVPEMMNVIDNNTLQSVRSYDLAFDLWWKHKLDKSYIERETKKFMDFLDIQPEELKNKRFLDAGCGIGILACGMSRFCYEVVAIDISRAIQIAFNKCGRRKKNLHYVRGDIIRIPFKKNYFDFICCRDVLMNVSDPLKALYNLFELLKDGGKIFITFYNASSDIMYWRIVYPIWKIVSKLPCPIQDLLSYVFAIIYISLVTLKHSERHLGCLFKRGRALYYEVFGTGFYQREDPNKIKEYLIGNGFEILKMGFSKTAFRFYIYGVKRKGANQ